MTITSKYNGTCKKCSGVIRQGEKIEWDKDTGPRHLACPAAPAQPAAKPSPHQGKFRRLEEAYHKAEQAAAAQPGVAEAPPAASGYQAYIAALATVKADPARSTWLREAARVLDLSAPADAVRDAKMLLQLQQMRVA